jgi:type 1 glutamine amidotransferase
MSKWIAASFCAIIAIAGFTRSSFADDASAAASPTTRPIKILMTSQTQGFHHSSIPVGREILKQLGTDTGKIDVTVDDALKECTADGLKAYDIVMFVNTTHELPIDASQKAALLEFIKSGKGFVGVHAATDTFYEWPDDGEMIGGYFDGHPWRATDTVTIKNEKPRNPITAPFGNDPFQLTEETYQLKAPYDRAKCEVLLSLDTSKTDMTKPGVKRTDGDFAVSWIKPYGKGRVFYTSLGHNENVWRDKRYQAHLLAGIEWAAGEGPDARIGE